MASDRTPMVFRNSEIIESSLPGTLYLHNTLDVWDIQTGEMLSTLEGHSDGIYSVAIAKDEWTVPESAFKHVKKRRDIGLPARSGISPLHQYD